MFQLTYRPSIGQSHHQPEVIQAGSDDSALAAALQVRLDALLVTKAAKLAELASASASAAREEHYAGTGVRVDATIRAAVVSVHEMEAEQGYLEAAIAGLTSSTLSTLVDRVAALE